MLTKENFIQFIKAYRQADDLFKDISIIIMGKNNGYYFESPLYDEFGKLSDCFLKSFFTDAGIDLILDWIYNSIRVCSIYKKDLFGDVKIDLKTIEDLWEYLNSDKIKFFKNEQSI